MEIHGFTSEQAWIADQMWDCESDDEVRTLIALYGNDAVTVYEMMIAAYCDDVNDPLDPEILEQIARKH
jgi:hypothetical protein